jgi:hypothetical protein
MSSSSWEFALLPPARIGGNCAHFRARHDPGLGLLTANVIEADLDGLGEAAPIAV